MVDNNSQVLLISSDKHLGTLVMCRRMIKMKSFKILCMIINALFSVTALGAGNSTCSAPDIQKFKDEYVLLQNSLKYEGKDIELKKNKVTAVGTATSYDNSPGKKTEIMLYNNYKNALIKVQKIYQKLNNSSDLNSSEKLVNGSSEVTIFFKALDPKNVESQSSSLTVNINTLIEKLQLVKLPGFELTKEDTYLLKNLLVHSQDRFCTLNKYISQPKKSNANKLQYLEQLKNSPLNQMIEALRKLSGTENLALANESTTIDSKVEEHLKALRAIIKGHKDCEKALRVLNIGEKIQGCNYDRFIKSIAVVDDAKFNSLESVMHFINANQQAKDAQTSLDWVSAQFKKDSNTRCYFDPSTKALYVQDIPLLKDQKHIDSSKFTCNQSEQAKSISAEACIKSLNINFENGLGFKVTPKEDSKISTISISNSSNCTNVPLSSEPVAPAVVPESPEDICKKDSKKEWKDNKCIEKVESLIFQNCDKKSCDEAAKTGSSFSWNEEKKSCIESSILDAAHTSVACSNKIVLTQADCDKEGKVLKENICEVKPVVVDPADKKEKECNVKIEADKDADTGTPLNNWSWNSTKKECVKKAEKKEGNSKEDLSEGKLETVYPDKPVPGRFQQVNIPTRQVFMLPGMP
jgi:hypothetical protein